MENGPFIDDLYHFLTCYISNAAPLISVPRLGVGDGL